MKIRTLLVVGFGLLLLCTITAAAQRPRKQTLRAGNKGEITITQPTKIGDIVLQPDTYIVQHRLSGRNHFVRFVELKDLEAQTTEGNYTYTEEDKAGEVECRIEPAGAPIKETRVYTVTDNGIPRITKVAIKGEEFVHIF